MPRSDAQVGKNVYEILVRGFRDLDEAESTALATRFVLILAHEIGNPEAVALAQRTLRAEGTTDPDPASA